MRKVLAILLVLGMLLTFAGCFDGSSNDDSYNNSYNDSYPTTVATTMATMGWDDEPDEVPITTDGYYGDNVTGSHYNPTEVPVEATTTTRKTTTRKTTQTSCDHWWSDATCTEPSTCYRCNKTQGKALGHLWQEATCDSPKKCSRCFTKVGEEAHSWSAATCTENQKCTLCGDVKYQTMLGHDYKNGFCTRCNRRDENYIDKISKGQTWVVNGQWKLTINSVELHDSCTPYNDDVTGQQLMVHYTYENIGYTGSSYGLYFSCYDFSVFDETGMAGDTSACWHDKDGEYCFNGSKSTASMVVILPNNSTKFTLQISEYLSGTYYKAQFSLDVPKSSSQQNDSKQYYLGSSVKKVEYVIPYTSCSDVKTGATSAGYNLFYYYKTNISRTQYVDYCAYVKGLGATLVSQSSAVEESVGHFSRKYSIDGISFYCTYDDGKKQMMVQFYDLKSLPSSY